MKTIRITSPVEVLGTHRADNEVVADVPDALAWEIVGAGRAVFVTVATEAPADPAPEPEPEAPAPRRGRPPKA